MIAAAARLEARQRDSSSNDSQISGPFEAGQEARPAPLRGRVVRRVRRVTSESELGVRSLGSRPGEPAQAPAARRKTHAGGGRLCGAVSAVLPRALVSWRVGDTELEKL